MRDFEPIIGATSPEVLGVGPMPAKTVQELVALVRDGKYNNFAVARAPVRRRICPTELFKLSLKLDIVTVPFGGGGPMVQSLVGARPGRIRDIAVGGGAQIKDGLLRALAVTSAKRIALFPTCRSRCAPDRCHEAPQDGLGARRYAARDNPIYTQDCARTWPDLKERIGYGPSSVPPDEFKALEADMPKWAKVIHDAGIRA